MRLGPAALATSALLALSLVPPAAAAPGAAGERAPTSVADAPTTDRAAATKKAVVSHTVVSAGRRYRLALRPVNIRAPQFGVYVQRPDGSLDRTRVARTKAYLGSVRGEPSSIAVAVRGRDGVLRGQITLDGRATAFFAGREVTGTRGTTTERNHWPSATGENADRNVTVRPAQVERFTRRWDVGYDLDFSYLGGELRGSVARALDAVELTTVEMLATYESNARLRPAIGRVVLRSAQASSPYAGKVAELGDVREAWRGALNADAVDSVAYLHSDGGGGGVAYLGTIGGDYAVSLNGSGNSIAIIRHELAHNWGAGDNHTNGPEGPTIESGNDYARFDGTELAAILAQRSATLAEKPGRFPRVATSTVAIAPYATLDLRDRVRSGTTIRIRPTANDIDANGDRVRVRSISTRTLLGARPTRRGDTITYRAPRVSEPRTLDRIRYRIVDEDGRTATGVVLLRVNPAGSS